MMHLGVLFILGQLLYMYRTPEIVFWPQVDWRLHVTLINLDQNTGFQAQGVYDQIITLNPKSLKGDIYSEQAYKLQDDLPKQRFLCLVLLHVLDKIQVFQLEGKEATQGTLVDDRDYRDMKMKSSKRQLIFLKF